MEPVALAASVAEGLVLHPAAHRIQASVRDAHHVERMRDTPGVVEARRQPGPEALRQVGDHHPDVGKRSAATAIAPRSEPAVYSLASMVHPSIGEFLVMQQQEQWLREHAAIDDGGAAANAAAAEQEREHQWAGLVLRAGTR